MRLFKRLNLNKEPLIKTSYEAFTVATCIYYISTKMALVQDEVNRRNRNLFCGLTLKDFHMFIMVFSYSSWSYSITIFIAILVNLDFVLI